MNRLNLVRAAPSDDRSARDAVLHPECGGVCFRTSACILEVACIRDARFPCARARSHARVLVTFFFFFFLASSSSRSSLRLSSSVCLCRTRSDVSFSVCLSSLVRVFTSVTCVQSESVSLLSSSCSAFIYSFSFFFAPLSLRISRDFSRRPRIQGVREIKGGRSI